MFLILKVEYIPNEAKGYKGDSLPIHQDPSNENHQVKLDSLVLLLNSRSRLDSFNQVGGNGDWEWL